jgi:tripartite-type tricarboxylate transporter receptor subunit TctC
VSSGYAQGYPARPVRIIVPNAPSGLVDISTRVVAAKLTDALGQQVIVENRVGAGSTIGTAAAVKATPDGYTLLAVFDSHATNPHLFKNLEYNTFADLAPITLLVRGSR